MGNKENPQIGGGGEVAFRNPYKSLYITLIYLYIPVYKGWSYC